MDAAFRPEEESLYRVIKNLEKDLGEMQKKMLLEKRAKEGQRIEKDWQDALLQKGAVNPVASPGAGQYLFFAVIMVSVFGGGWFVLTTIKKMD